MSLYSYNNVSTSLAIISSKPTLSFTIFDYFLETKFKSCTCTSSNKFQQVIFMSWTLMCAQVASTLISPRMCGKSKIESVPKSTPSILVVMIKVLIFGSSSIMVPIVINLVQLSKIISSSSYVTPFMKS